MKDVKELSVLKFALEVVDTQEISMPENAHILCVQIQDEMPHMWVLCNPRLPYEFRTIEFHATGESMSNAKRQYIDTINGYPTHLVLHVFELL